MLKSAAVVLLLVWMFTWGGFAQDEKEPAVLYAEDFEDATIPTGWHGAPSGLVALDVGNGFDGGNCLKFHVDPQGNNAGLLALNLDASMYKGKAILIEAMLKGNDITIPIKKHLGTKLMVHVKTLDSEVWPDAAKTYGTFDWRKGSVFARIPDDCQILEILLGMQDCTGTFWVDNLRIREIPQPTPPARNATLSSSTHTTLRGMMSGHALTEEDIKTFGQAWRANLMRYQIDNHEKLDVSSSENVTAWLNSKLSLLDQRLPLFRKYGVNIVIDLHSPPRMTQNSLLSTSLSWDKSTQDELVRVWEIMANKYKDEPAIWGYDILNEPMENDYVGENLDWNRLAERVAKAIRVIDPQKFIIIEPAPLAAPGALKTFIPVDVPNVVYSIHCYQPIGFTHQGVVGNESVSYPGISGGKLWNKEALEKDLAPAMEFQRKYNVPIYVGEFSVARWAPGDSAVNWLRDIIDIFEANGWNWTYHAFREADCWSVESGSDRNDKARLATTPRKELLLEYFKRNK